MNSETWAVIGVGVTLLGVLVPLLLSLHSEVSQVRCNLNGLAERVARIEGALSGPYRLPVHEAGLEKLQ